MAPPTGQLYQDTDSFRVPESLASTSPARPSAIASPAEPCSDSVDSWLVDVHVSGQRRQLRRERRRRHRVRGNRTRAGRTPSAASPSEPTHTADEYRAMWDTIERLWSATVAGRAAGPYLVLDERSTEESSFAETLRHLVFATDAWASRMVLDDPLPFDRIGFPPTGYPPADAEAIGIDLDASRSRTCWRRADRMAMVRRIVDGLTDDELECLCTRCAGARLPRGATHGAATSAGRDERGVRTPPVRRARPRRAGEVART